MARELARYRLDLVRVQELKWDKGGAVQEEDYIFSMERKLKSSIRDRIFCIPYSSISS